MTVYENIIGNKYGKLTVIDEISIRKNGRTRYYVKCLCDCGNTTTAEKAKVKNGITTSCGCVQKQMRNSLGERFRKPNTAFNELYNAYKKSALRRNYSFELSKEEFENIATKPCIYCGDNMTHIYRRNRLSSFRYTGVDRFDNTKGYTIENCVPCCKICNRLKSNMTIDEFEQRLTKVLARKDMWQRTA